MYDACINTKYFLIINHYQLYIFKYSIKFELENVYSNSIWIFSVFVTIVYA